MGVKEYFLNPKKRQVYVEALSKSVPIATPPASNADTKAESRARKDAVLGKTQ